MQGSRVLVTGGGGFLGQSIVKALLARGDSVRVLGRNPYPALSAAGAECVRADVRDPEALDRAMTGIDSIFHVAARVGYWGPRQEYVDINVNGTTNVLASAKKAGVSRMVYTSSPSVVIGTRGNIENADESMPYPKRHLYDYAATKAEAEKRVLEANDLGGLRTASIRPHFIFGPGDPQIVPRLVDNAQRGTLVRIGNGSNKVDVTYVDNAVLAHLLCHDALGRDASPVAGQAYFIGQEKPVVLWQFIARVLEAFSAPPVKKKIPLVLARILGATVESVYKMLSLSGEPPITRSVAMIMGTSHYFSHAKATRDFGYEPQVTIEEGIANAVSASA